MDTHGHTWKGSVNLYDWNAFMDKHIVEAEMGEGPRGHGGEGGGSSSRRHSSSGAAAWFEQPGGKWLASRGPRVEPRPGVGR